MGLVPVCYGGFYDLGVSPDEPVMADVSGHVRLEEDAVVVGVALLTIAANGLSFVAEVIRDCFLLGVAIPAAVCICLSVAVCDEGVMRAMWGDWAGVVFPNLNGVLHEWLPFFTVRVIISQTHVGVNTKVTREMKKCGSLVEGLPLCT
jgi:hypothetical protein